MHELGIVVHAVDELEKVAVENNVSKITKVTMEIGEVSAIVPDLFKDAFEWCKKKSEHLKEAELEMIIIEGISYCRDCKNTFKTTTYAKQCPHCNSTNTYLVTGNEVTIKSVEAE